MKRSTKLLLAYWSVIDIAWFFLTLSTPMGNVEAGLTIAVAAASVGALAYIVTK